MKSFTQGRNLYGSWTKNTASANLLLGDQMANDDYRALCSLKDWPFLEKSRTIATQASIQFYNLPHDTSQVRAVSVLVGTTTYDLKLSPSKDHWDQLNLSTFTSDIPEWYFILAGQIGLWPKPATGGNTIQLTIKARVIDLSATDYTTGTIVSIAAGGTALVGSATAWAAPMVGRFIRITLTDVANAGDGEWYEISAVGSATTITLVRAYGGTAISAGSAAYTLAQMPLLPEDFHDLPWQYAAGMYWGKESDKRAGVFLNAHGNSGGGRVAPSGRVKDLINAWSAPTSNMVINDGADQDIINPNLVIRL